MTHAARNFSPYRMELEQSEFERAPVRPPLRPPIGIPLPPGEEDRRLRSFVTSLILHVLLVALVLLPPILGSRLIEQQVQGAGGPGPAGGGGGGRGGTGGVDKPVEERLRYIQVAPAQVPTPEAVKPVVPPPVEQKKPDVPPPVDLKIETVKPQVDFSLVSGTGGGTGNDGSNGSGPGSGGGVGSGVGTGRGSANGPGTGGGPGTIYPPTPVETFIPPMPIPQRARGMTVVALFEVDEQGNVLKFDFTPTKDGGYNRRLRETLGGTRFRPATRWDGTPVRAQATLSYTLW